MKTPPAEKTLYYRRARFSESMDRTAQQMLSDALSQLKQVRDRLEAVDSEATEFRVISASNEEGGFLCGRLATFTRGGYQTVIADDPAATNLSLTAIEPPPSQDGVQQQFATGILYFCVFQDHVAVVQSASLRAGGFERHLAWLLRDRTGILTAQQGIGLSDEPQKATRERIKRAHVKSVMLGRPLLQHTEVSTGESGTGKVQSRFRGTGPIVELFRDWIDPRQFERLGLDGVFDGNLEVWIEIRYPKRSRSQPDDAIRLLDDLALALRDVEEDEARLQLADGTTVTGDQLKISTKVSVPVMGSRLIDEADLYASMRNWLETLIRNGSVSE